MKKFRISKETFGNLGAVVTGINALLIVINFAVSVIVFKQSISTDLLTTIINLFFYIMICNYFLKGRDQFYYSLNAVSTLIICDYVLYAIINVLAGALSGFGALSISTLAGIAYFVFMVLDRKKNEKKFVKWMLVCGSVLLILNLFSSILTCVSLASSFNSMNLFFILITFAEELMSVGFGLIFFIYPFVLMREKY